MTCPASRSPRGGYILVAVLAVMVLATAFVAAGSTFVRSALVGAKVESDQVFVSGLTQSGVELSAYQLFVLKLPLRLVDGRRLRLTGGMITPHIADEAGKADLNASLPRLLESEFVAGGVAPRAAQAVVARILLMRGDKAGSAPRQGLDAESGSKRRPILSLDVLANLPELEGYDLARLEERFTVFNSDGKIDILDAAPDVLAGIPGLDPKQVEIIVAERDKLSGDGAKALVGRFGGEVASFLKSEPGPAYAVQIDATTLKGRKNSLSVVLASSKSPNVPYYVLDWRD